MRHLAVLLALTVGTVGCGSGDLGVAGASGGDGELTAEADAALNPPPPTDVRVEAVDEAGVELAWDAPLPPTVPHNYSDEVIGYRVSRRAAGELEFTPLGVVDGTRFLDASVDAGGSYEYVVSSIRQMQVEGGVSDPPVGVTIP